MPEAKQSHEIPDIQNQKDGFPKRYINKVGIRGVRLPVSISRKDGTFNESVAELSVYSDLNKETKGVNMSRYRVILENNFVQQKLYLKDAVRYTMDEIRKELIAENAWLKVKFEYFLTRFAPVSKIPSLQSYDCVLEGRLIDNVSRYFLTVIVPYTSLCPCSKEMSQYNAHNQRSFGSVTVELLDDQICWIEDIIDLVEATSSAPIINILKRPDEKWQTELMYENPAFVEDMARKIATQLDLWLDKKIKDYVFIANHEESIHMHTACSVINAGRELR